MCPHHDITGQAVSEGNYNCTCTASIAVLGWVARPTEQYPVFCILQNKAVSYIAQTIIQYYNIFTKSNRDNSSLLTLTHLLTSEHNHVAL